MPRGSISRLWPELETILGPAIDRDTGTSREAVREWLESGLSEAFLIDAGNAGGVAVTTIGPIDGVEVCWLNYVAGTSNLAPRAFVRLARDVAEQIEILARNAGCAEMRGGGRNWSRVFPDWERFDPDYPNRMRKKIAHG